MKTLCTCLAALLALAWSDASFAVGFDLVISDVQVLAPNCTDPPIMGAGSCVKVDVQNIGDAAFPDGDLEISVDIDEPTKPGDGNDPGIERVCGARSLHVAGGIAAGATKNLTYGFCAHLTWHAWSHQVKARVSALAEPPANTGNNEKRVGPYRIISALPAVGTVALLTCTAGLMAAAFLALRRRRARQLD